MGKLWAFFSSFDKLMKEKLVKAFYWLVLCHITIHYIRTAFNKFGLDEIEGLFVFLLYFVSFFMLVVGFRLACELAIALFRINDNLSPDGGKSETANIDPLLEARRVAEAAAIRARDVTKSTYEKTTAATKSTFDKASDAIHPSGDAPAVKANPARTPNVKPAATKTTYKKAAPKKAAPKKTAAKPATKKTTTTKKPVAKKTTSARKKVSGVTYNKDGSVRKRPGPKSGSSSKYTKDGRLKRKPGPKPK